MQNLHHHNSSNYSVCGFTSVIKHVCVSVCVCVLCMCLCTVYVRMCGCMHAFVHVCTSGQSTRLLIKRCRFGPAQFTLVLLLFPWARNFTNGDLV